MPTPSAKVEKINKALSELPPPFHLLHIDPETDSGSYELALRELLKYFDASLFCMTRYLEETGGDDPYGTIKMLQMHGACFGLYRVLVENRP